MKNIFFTSLVAATLGASAQAGTLSLDARADYESNTYNEAAHQKDSARFNMQTLRLDAKNNLNEDTSFRLRFRLNNPSSGNNAGTGALSYNLRDSLNRSVDFAYIQHKLMDNLSVQAGKIGTDIGGIEGMTTGPDLYFTSQGYNEQSAFRYQTGLKLIYAMDEQELSVMTTNQEADTTVNRPGVTPAATTFAQDHTTIGVVYKGSFMDKTFMPVVSWHNDKAQPQTSPVPGIGAVANETENNYYAVGFKYDWAPFFVEADYLYDTFKDLRVVGETDKNTSIVATVGGRMNNWVGKLKYEDSTPEIVTGAGTSEKNKINGYQAALEYLPTGDKTYRYHVAYVSRDIKPANDALSGISGVTSSDTQNTQTVFAGVRILADFLK